MSDPHQSAPPEISAAEAIEAVDAGGYLIDVREQNEWDVGHAPRATLLPMSEFVERISEVPSGEPLLIVCHSGMRSMRVTDYLIREGYDAVNITGGMVAWNAAGGEIESNGPGTPRV